MLKGISARIRALSNRSKNGLLGFNDPHPQRQVNSSSVKRAEELIGALRDAIGLLSLIPIAPKNIPIQVMTQWIEKGNVPAGFELGQACELRDNSDATSVIRCTNQNLQSPEINNHIKASMYASKLALSWQERVECVVDDKLAIKRLRFSDLVQEKADEVDAQDAVEQFDVDFSIMTLELSAFIKALLEAFGGEDLSKTKPGEKPAEKLSEKPAEKVAAN